MIANLLVFVLGFLFALLLALVVAPLVWRRARRLAFREFAATIPTNANEIRAAADHLRAATAFETRRREIEAAALNERAAVELVEAGRMARDLAEIRERNRGLIETLSQHKADLEEFAETLEARDEEIEHLAEDLANVRAELQARSEDIEDLVEQLDEARRVNDERAGSIEELQSEIDTLTDEMRDGEQERRDLGLQSDRFRDELAVMENRWKREQSRAEKLDQRLATLTATVASAEATSRGQLAKDTAAMPPATSGSGATSQSTEAPDDDSDKVSSQEEARPPLSLRERLGLGDDVLARFRGLEGERLREEVSRFAAEVIHHAAEMEGVGSELRAIMDRSESDPTVTDGSRLADRARRIRTNKMDEAAE